eukprot:1945583-Alexandrium_andersonii.AAC.1
MDGAAPTTPVELARQCLTELLRWESEPAAVALATWLWRVALERGQAGCTAHQWSLTIWVWVLGAARVEQVARVSPDAFMAIEAALGLSAVAARQRPFRDWRQGRSAGRDGTQVPGTRAS